MEDAWNQLLAKMITDVFHRLPVKPEKKMLIVVETKSNQREVEAIAISNNSWESELCPPPNIVTGGEVKPRTTGLKSVSGSLVMTYAI